MEKWNPHARIRQDLFGFIDIVALDHMPGIVGIQTTTAQNLWARVRKVNDDPKLAGNARLWLDRGNRIEFHGWVKRGSRWACRYVDLAPDPLSRTGLLPVEREPNETDAKILSRSKITKRARSVRTRRVPTSAAPPEARPAE